VVVVVMMLAVGVGVICFGQDEAEDCVLSKVSEMLENFFPIVDIRGVGGRVFLQFSSII